MCSFLSWLLAAWIAASSPVFASIPDLFRPLETLDGPAAQTRQHNAADQITSVLRGGPAATNLPSFDPCGNMTQIVLSVKGQTFTTINCFDPENRLLGVTRIRNGTQGESVTTSVMQLEYDGQGLLLRLTDNGTVRRLVRDRTDQLAKPLVETDASGNALRWFVWNGRSLAQVGTSGVIRLAHCDELGRVVAFTDSNGALVDEFSYGPYGRLIAHSGATATPFTWLGAYGVWDAGHGLYLTRHRAYDANLARFGQVDPAGLVGGLNLYALANGSPLALIDSLGLCPDSPSWGQGIGSQYINPVDLNPHDPFGGRWVPIASSAFHAGQNIANGQYGRASLNLAQSITEAAVVRNVITAIGRQIAGNVVAQETASISTRYAVEVQSASAEARVALNQAQNGATLFRTGELGTSMAGESQYWSLQSPLARGYANSMGMPNVMPNFMMGGTLNPGASAIANQAVGLGANAGRGIQIVTSEGGVGINWFHMP